MQLPGDAGGEFLLRPADVRRNDTSASAVDEWTGGAAAAAAAVPDDVRPTAVNPLGNYAVQITWDDGFNQVAPFELLERLRPLAVPRKEGVSARVAGGLEVAAALDLV